MAQTEAQRNWYVRNRERILEEAKAKYNDSQETIKESRKEYYANNRDKVRGRQKSYYSENKTTMDESSRLWALLNPDKVKMHKAKWRSLNRDTINASTNRRRALKADAQGKYTSKDVDRISLEQTYTCNGCCCDLTKSGYHVDHIVPLSKGGSNWPTNLQLLCPGCNMSKGALMPIDWANKIKDF